jgi:hypothetical protein
MTITMEKPLVVTINNKKHLNVDLTAMRLFIQLLNHARALKNDLNMGKNARSLYLRGMKAVMVLNFDDFRIADNHRDRWKQQNSGACQEGPNW